jgi:hypothetical protein
VGTNLSHDELGCSWETLMMYVFAKAKKAPPVQESLSKMREAMENLEKREAFLQQRHDHETEIARKNAHSNKRGLSMGGNGPKRRKENIVRNPTHLRDIYEFLLCCSGHAGSQATEDVRAANGAYYQCSNELGGLLFLPPIVVVVLPLKFLSGSNSSY